MVLVMKYYKIKTVAFYAFVTTIMSFDLKGSENEKEGSCSCCNCWDNKEKPEVGEKPGEEKKEDEKNDEEKKKEDKKEEKKEEKK